MNQFVKVRDLADRLSCSTDSIYRWIRQGQFPRPVKLGVRMSAWRVEDIELWLEAKGGKHDEI